MAVGFGVTGGGRETDMGNMIHIKTGKASRHPGKMERIRAAAAAWAILGILAVLAIPAIILMTLITGVCSWWLRIWKRLAAGWNRHKMHRNKFLSVS